MKLAVPAATDCSNGSEPSSGTRDGGLWPPPMTGAAALDHMRPTPTPILAHVDP